MKKMKNISKFANRIENASMAELVDALDSKSSVLGRAGSIPALSTDKPQKSGIASELQKRSSLLY